MYFCLEINNYRNEQCLVAMNSAWYENVFHVRQEPESFAVPYEPTSFTVFSKGSRATQKHTCAKSSEWKLLGETFE